MIDSNRSHITIGRILRLPPLLLAGVCAVAAQSTSGPLPAPTGAWPIGRTSVQIIDSNRKGSDGVQSRRLMLHIWYPASPTATRTALPYIERLEKAGPALSDDERDLLKTVQTHAFNAPSGVPPTSRFPVLLLSHGEQMNGFLYSNLVEELTSHGYVVIAVDHPGAALFVAYQDGSVASYSDPGTDQRSRVAERAEDLRFVRGRIGSLEVRGRRLAVIISGRVGAFGHSSGGLAAAMRNPGDRGVAELAEIVRGLVVEFFDATLRGSTRKSIAPKSNSDIDLEVLVPAR